MQGAFSGVWGLAGLVGPLTGGLIVKYLTWHWVFLFFPKVKRDTGTPLSTTDVAAPH